MRTDLNQKIIKYFISRNLFRYNVKITILHISRVSKKFVFYVYFFKSNFIKNVYIKTEISKKKKKKMALRPLCETYRSMQKIDLKVISIRRLINKKIIIHNIFEYTRN